MKRLLVLALLLAACRRPPPPEEPGAAEYHEAVLLFAKVSAETGDLTYRDPRFDEVLTALQAVPPGGEAVTRALELRVRIQQARIAADTHDREAALARAALESPPIFQPLPHDAPMPLAPGGRPNAAAAVPAPASGSAPAPTAPPVPGAPPAARPLPSWYQHPTLSPVRPLGADSPPDPAPAAEPAAEPTPEPPPAAELAPARREPPRPPSEPPPGPPAVFGLPGPASNAMQGRP